VPIVIVFSLVMAMILNMGLKGTGLLRTVFFLPVIIMSGPVMKKLIENGATTIQGAAENALVQNILGMLPEQLASILNNLLSSFIMILWFCGVQILIFLSALQKVDKPVYEAAKIDGASKWAQFWKITLPTLRPMIIVNMLYTIVSISSFELNEVIVLIQKDSFAANYGLGYASALSFLYFVVLILIMVMFVGIYGLRSPTDRRIAKETKQLVKQLEKIHRTQSKSKKAR
jgi:ABC-type sugar transport system permease subunit